MQRTNCPALDAILGTPFNVLDKGSICILDYMGDDSSVVQAARVSFGMGVKSSEEDKRLINFLMNHEHTSPFEMVEGLFFVKAPIFVFRQWVRHRTAEIYGCTDDLWYNSTELEKYCPSSEVIGSQDIDNKQSRIIDDSEMSEIISKLLKKSSCTGPTLASYISFYWKTDLYNLLRFVRLRSAPGAQLEIRAYADVIQNIVERWVPDSFSAYKKYVMNRKHLTAQQIKWLVEWARDGASSIQLSSNEYKSMIAITSEFCANDR